MSKKILRSFLALRASCEAKPSRPALWAALMIAAAGCGESSTEPLRLGSSTSALTLEDSLTCVSEYAHRGECDWAHWSEMYERCHTYEQPLLDDGYLIDQVKTGHCTWPEWSALYDRIRQTPHPAAPQAPEPNLEDSLTCVSEYAHRGECDWAHWSEMYERCHTYEQPLLDDGYLIDQVKTGHCTWPEWSALYDRIRQTPHPAAPQAPAPDLEDSLTCVSEYAHRGECDWAHWSEMYERCRTYEQPLLDDGYLLDQVRAGYCTWPEWSALYDRVRQTPHPAPCAPPTPSPSFDNAVACVAGYAARGACDWDHWTELYLACRTYDHTQLDDGYLLAQVRAGACTSAGWPALEQRLRGSHATGPAPLPLNQALMPSPGLIAGDQLELERAEWLSMQRYVALSLALPTTDAGVQSWLQLQPGTDFAPFVPLRAALSDVHGHAQYWDATLFPAVLGLAQDLRDYASTIDTTYAPLSEAATRLDDAPEDPEARSQLATILLSLADDAATYERQAGSVEQQLHDFAANVQSDAATLTRLQSDYDRQYGASSGEAARLTSQIEQDQADLRQTHADYDHYVAVAASTASYAWIWPFGMIAAAAVAGEYGGKATDAMNHIHQLEAAIASLDASRAAAYRVTSGTKNASTNVSSTRDAVAAALPAIQRLRGHWQVMHAALEDVAQRLNDPEWLPTELDVELARDSWDEVAKTAANYLGRARIVAH